MKFGFWKEWVEERGFFLNFCVDDGKRCLVFRDSIGRGLGRGFGRMIYMFVFFGFIW